MTPATLQVPQAAPAPAQGSRTSSRDGGRGGSSEDFTRSYDAAARSLARDEARGPAADRRGPGATDASGTGAGSVKGTRAGRDGTADAAAASDAQLGQDAPAPGQDAETAPTDAELAVLAALAGLALASATASATPASDAGAAVATQATAATPTQAAATATLTPQVAVDAHAATATPTTPGVDPAAQAAAADAKATTAVPGGTPAPGATSAGTAGLTQDPATASAQPGETRSGQGETAGAARAPEASEALTGAEATRTRDGGAQATNAASTTAAATPVAAPTSPTPATPVVPAPAVDPAALQAAQVTGAGRAEAPAGAPSTAAVDQVALATQLGTQLTALRSLGSGQHVLQLQVNPESFGPVRVVAQIGADGVRIELVGASDAAREALRAAMPDLRRDLVAAGLRADLEVGTGRQGSADTANSGFGTDGRGDRAGLRGSDGQGVGGRGTGARGDAPQTGPTSTPTVSGDGRLDLLV